MQPAPNAAMRRFRLVKAALIAAKLAALGGILLLIIVYSGGL